MENESKIYEISEIFCECMLYIAECDNNVNIDLFDLFYREVNHREVHEVVLRNLSRKKKPIPSVFKLTGVFVSIWLQKGEEFASMIERSNLAALEVQDTRSALVKERLGLAAIDAN